MTIEPDKIQRDPAVMMGKPVIDGALMRRRHTSTTIDPTPCPRAREARTVPSVA